jgi:muramoyltetrapeptide carboxypeptidase
MIARLPPPVVPGDRIGVAALGGPVRPERLEAGIAALRALGFEPVLASNLGSRHDLFAGGDAERLGALYELADDASLRAIFFARGGHGALRLLPSFDWDRIGRNPRAWVGYSDLTPFLLGIVQRVGLVAFHGPMVAADLARGLTPDERDSLLATLAGEFPAVFAASDALLAADAPERCEGVLLGGCLSLLCATLGTPWAPDLSGAILLLEDVAEPTYRLDRMLTHLYLSGSLTGVRGVVLGDFRGTEEAKDEPSTLPGRVAAVAAGVPVLAGLECGHVAPNRTLPLGLVASIDAGNRTLTVGAESSAR